MNLAYVRMLYEYDRWANRRLLGAVSGLTEEQFKRPLVSSFPSIRDTMVHILSAEWMWFERWQGRTPAAMLDPESFPTARVLAGRWTELERGQVAFLSALSEERLQKEARYTTTSGKTFSHPLWEQMAHLANHSTYHRGQITTLLRQVGASPVSTDLIAFFREKQSG